MTEPFNPTAPDFKQKYEERLKQEAKNIDDRQIRELADKLLKDTFFVRDRKGNEKFNPVIFVDHVLKSFPGMSFITPMNDQGGDVTHRYVPELGIFQNTGIPFVEQILLEILGTQAAPAYYPMIKKTLQVKTYTPPEDFEENPYMVIMKNGAFNILSGELEPFSPDHKAKCRIPVTYNPEAKCPTFLAFLKEVVPDEVDFIQEWFGYHLWKEYIFQRCVVFYGSGDNGKTTLLNVLEAFLGPENLSSKSLYELTTDKFAVADLYGKLGNNSPDVGSDELKHTGIIKSLTGNDMISAQRKNRDPFKYRNYAKLTLACNQIPTTPDESLAFFKRFIVVVFEITIAVEDQDPTLTEKMTTQDELSGIFNWAYEGLKRALERGHLNETRDTQQKKDFYLAMSDPVRGFFNDNIDENYQEFETKQDVLNAFNKYCRNKHYVIPSERAFYENFKNLANLQNYNPKLYTEDHPTGKQTACYKGIKLSNPKDRSEYYKTKEAFDAVYDPQRRLT